MMNTTYSSTISQLTAPATRATPEVRKFHDEEIVVLSSDFHSSPGEETHHLVEIYVIADKAVDFIGDVRKLHLSGCVLPDHLGHLREHSPAI